MDAAMAHGTAPPAPPRTELLDAALEAAAEQNAGGAIDARQQKPAKPAKGGPAAKPTNANSKLAAAKAKPKPKPAKPFILTMQSAGVQRPYDSSSESMCFQHDEVEHSD